MKNYNAILCDTDDMLAEDSNQIRHDKMKRIAGKYKHAGDTKNSTLIIADSGKLRVYVKPGQDIEERLNHYQSIYPDAKIVK